MIMKKCLQCGKKHGRKKFCCNKCKDRYHNIHNPRGFFAKDVEDVEDQVHLFSQDGIGQDFPV